MTDTSVTTPNLYVGFDLGTTNSAAAVFDGDQVNVVRTSTGGALTPSVVRIDKRQRVTVGQRALRAAEKDPANCQREFKRLMGSAEALRFAAAGIDKRPEELSALILESMCRDVHDVAGVLPLRAVISVPALFELPQNAATSEAAKLAGLEQVELLQEPIASALAAGWRQDDPGSWLVYDLGGGTFDVSLLETRDGLLRVIAHDGDNFLGGRDFDRAILRWLLERLGLDPRGIDRKNVRNAYSLARLLLAVEQAKIELSRAEEAEILLEEPLEIDGVEIDVDLVLDRSALQSTCGHLVERSLAVCQRLLNQRGLDPSQLSRIVMVGGPSVMPMVRRAVEEGLRTPLAEGFDPMTLVAQGAAIYAATASLDARPTRARARSTGVAVWCQFPPITADLHPFVVGKVEGVESLDAARRPATLSLQRMDDSKWESASHPVDAEGAFAIDVELRAHAVNRFALRARNAEGLEVDTEPSEISIVHGVTIGDPPLSRSIGVALANNLVFPYFERGMSLPARRTFTHHTVEAIAPGSAQSLLAVPIVQGEYEEAHLCQLVGTLEIAGTELKSRVAGGSPVEVTLEVDRGGKLSASARIACAEGVQVFTGVARLLMPEASLESLREGLALARKRVMESQGDAFRDGEREHVSALERLHRDVETAEELIENFAAGDGDAGQRAVRLLRDVDAQLSDMAAQLGWPEAVADAEDTYAWALSWVGLHGRASEVRVLERAGTALQHAIARTSLPELKRQLRTIRQLGNAAFRRDPGSWEVSFDSAVARLHEANDLPAAKRLEAEGRAAIETGDASALRSIVQKLWKLLPADPVARRMSFGSGLR